ncbi:MAG: insulinase family protein [candidate division WOR-3 bacterium]|nr:MAG: insulinase family protein [candidate division WOR-3 bacterium]
MIDNRNSHIEETALPGGLLLITERLPYVRSVALGLTYHLGGRDDPVGKEGAAHLVEHMIFQGNDERNAKAISIAAESLGADLNAFTDKEMTCFYGRFPSDEQVKVTKLLGDILAAPGFGEPELAKEKRVIGEEIRTINEDPDATASSLMFRAHYGEHPMGSQVIGTQTSVAGIDRQWLKRFYDERYHAGTGVAVAVGDVRPEEIADALGQALADRAGSGPGPQRSDSQPNAGAVLSEKRNELSQVYVCLCWAAFRYSDERRHALSVLNTAFGGGVSSRLFQRLREDEGLVYSVSSFVELFQDSGLLGVYFVTDRRKLERCLETLGTEINRLRTGWLQKEEFERARSMTKSSVLLGLEGPTARMMRMARTHHMLGRLVTVDETLAAYNRLDLDGTNALVEEIFDRQKPTLGAVGPIGAEEAAGVVGRLRSRPGCET